MADFDRTNLRFIGSGETDYDSPNSELLNTGYRQNIESLVLQWFGTGVTGTATSDPSNDTNGYFYDTAAGFSDDEHNGRTLLITSGNAKGFFYTIDDTVAASDRLACTGDNLYSDGVRSGDSYAIVYDLKVNTSGHNHDGVNSKAFTIPSNTITKAMMNNDSVGLNELYLLTYSNTQAVSAASGATLAMTNSAYLFVARFYKSTGSGQLRFVENAHAYPYFSQFGASADSGDARVEEYGGSFSATAAYTQLYVASSGEKNWYFLLKNKKSGLIFRTSLCADHPNYFNEGHEHPWIKDFDPKRHEVLVSIVPDPVLDDLTRAYGFGNEIAGLDELFEIDEKHPMDYPKEEVNLRTEFLGREKAIPKFKSVWGPIQKPAYIKAYHLKEMKKKKSYCYYIDDFVAKHGKNPPLD